MSKFFWCIEYAATFIEIFLCCYFCGTFVVKNEMSRYRNRIIPFSVIASIIIIILNNIRLFSNVTTVIFILLCIIIQCICYRKKYLLSTGLVLVYAVMLSAVDALSIYIVSLFINSDSGFILGEQSFIRIVCILLSKSILTILVITANKVIVEGYEQKKNNLLIEMNRKMLQKSLDETEQTFELWKQSIHNYKNNIIALSQLAKEGKLEEIKTYLKNESEMIEQKMFYVKTGNSVVDAILNTKQNIAEKNNILFIVNASITNDIVISDMDIANILGNIMDNAIEAEKNETEPYIETVIKMEKNFLIITVKNKLTKPLPEKLTNKENPEFHGIGLKSVKKTIKKYDGQLKINTENETFTVSILIQNKIADK